MKILVLDDFDDFSVFERAVKKIKEEIEIVYAIDKDGKLDKDKLEKNIWDSNILIVGHFNKEIFHKANKLKWVHCTSAGVNKLLFPEFIKSKVILTNSRGIHPIPITEHVFAAILCFQRRFKDHIKNQIKKEWKYERSDELCGRTIGIVGVGEIGKRIAEIGKAFGCHIIGVKRSVNEKINNVDELYSVEELDKLLKASDYVVLCLPSTEKTKNMFDISKFRMMKKNSVLINIGRGDAVKDEDLVKALKEKIIAGAALDVFREEPLPKESHYYGLDNILITPHHSGSTLKYDERSIKIFCENLKLFLEGKKLKTKVDKIEGY
ncbi:D-2-hydroxyacid dehydrogenase [Candidatus Woesearchaeota archaeon]|nr:D-2-hydroxyacid dehydrogenase [Candidatus Woesearchaeota archaeon]